MNTLFLRSFGLSLVLIGTLTACKDDTATATAPAPSANIKPAPPAATPETAAPPTATAEEEATAPTAIPDTADAIWLAVDKHSAELKATIASNDLKQVHHHAFAIRDLIAALPARSPSLPVDDQAKLQSEIKFVATLADRLDETGDAGDQDGAQANYDKLVTVLNGITRTK